MKCSCFRFEKRGEIDPPSDNLIVQLGVAAEHLNRQWFEQNTGRVITMHKRVQHMVRWMGVPLDRMITPTGAVFSGAPMLVGAVFAQNKSFGALVGAGLRSMAP